MLYRTDNNSFATRCWLENIALLSICIRAVANSRKSCLSILPFCGNIGRSCILSDYSSYLPSYYHHHQLQVGYTIVVPMNVIVVVLWTSGVTYRNSCKAHIFHRSRCIQRVLDHLLMWNTSRDMDNLVNEGLPTPTRHASPWLEAGKRSIGRLYSSYEHTNV